MVHRNLIAAGAAALVLAGCASAPHVRTTASATLPPAAATYRLVEADPATVVDARAAEALGRQLKARGWREVGEGAAWRLSAAYAVQPPTVGGYTDESAREEAWVVEPAPARWWARARRTHRLTATLTGPGETAATYQAGAAVTMRARDSEAAIERLAEAVAAGLTPET